PEGDVVDLDLGPRRGGAVGWAPRLRAAIRAEAGGGGVLGGLAERLGGAGRVGHGEVANGGVVRPAPRGHPARRRSKWLRRRMAERFIANSSPISTTMAAAASP